MANATVLTPAFNGMQIFGDPTQFAASVLAGSAVDVDAWLSVTPGTTVYSPNTSGGAFAVSGVLLDTSSAAVLADQVALTAATALRGVDFGRPTGLPWPPVYLIHTGCWIEPAELIFGAGGIVAVGNGLYQLPYRAVVRQIGTGTRL